jgi:hypothetical protein
MELCRRAERLDLITAPALTWDLKSWIEDQSEGYRARVCEGLESTLDALLVLAERDARLDATSE